MTSVRQWLDSLGLGQYADAFERNDIDAEMLAELDQELLQQIGVASVGHRVKILKAIKGTGPNARSTEPTAAQPDSPSPTALSREPERRQLTVMFCDLADSTALSESMDLEDYREILGAYQSAASKAINQYDGYIARYMGDGLLVYFGYPQAHEDDPERAVRAGLDIVDAVRALKPQDQIELQVRVSIATGLVVAGDIVGEGASEEHAVLGDTPNLAARLQSVATPNHVVIADSTQRLIEGRFELEALGPRTLKGISAPVLAYRALRVRDASRFEAAHAGRLTPLIGRDEEFGMLWRRWELAKQGEGQVVLLEGEPGIGKSRISEALREQAQDEPHVLFRYQCSPYHMNSAFYPISAQLGHAAGFNRRDDPRSRLAKLESMLADEDSATLPLIAALLSLPTDRYPPLEGSAVKQRADTVAVLVKIFERQAREEPALVMMEDAHWMDPSTLDVFDLMVDAVQDLPGLIVVTHRPEFDAPWARHGHVTQHSLNRLGRSDGAAIIEQLTGAKSLPDEVRTQIIAKADGIPLFVEELTKTLLESGLLQQHDDHYALVGPLPALAIPNTLQDSLMARLDRMSPIKEVAQTAAVLGREFSPHLLARISPLDEVDLEHALAQLVEGGLLNRRGSTSDTSYLFKHALVQDSAYESLLISRRRQVHARVAHVLEEEFPETVENQPELLAQHFTAAEQIAAAFPYWYRAGKRAAERSANKEAVAHLNKALELISRLGDTVEHRRLELDVYATLGPALLLTHGFGVPEVRQAFERMRELAAQLGDKVRAFGATFGSWLHHQGKAEFVRARELIDELFLLAEQSDEPIFVSESRHSAWTTCINVGDFQGCREHIKLGLAGYDAVARQHHPLPFVHDPGVCGATSEAMALWFLGYPEKARSRNNEALVLAQDLSHIHTVVTAEFFGLIVLQFLRDSEAAVMKAKQVTDLCREHGPGHWLAAAQVIEGWAMVQTGLRVEGKETCRRGIDAYMASGSAVRAPYYLGLLGQTCALSGFSPEGLEAIDKALALSERTGEHHWDAELHRLRGEFLAHDNPNEGFDAARSSIHRALDVARGQNARSLELRAAISLAHLWSERGDSRKAHGILFPVFEQFTEGFNTPDLRQAQAFLHKVS